MIKYYSTTVSGKTFGIVEMDENFNILRFSFTKNPKSKKFRLIADELKKAIDSGRAEVDLSRSDSYQLVFALNSESEV